MHRSSLEESIKTLDVQRDNQKTKMLVDGVVGLINPALEKLNEKSNAQTDYLAKQGEALLKLLESKTSISDVLPAEFPFTPITQKLSSLFLL